jgi:hypothetical protein
MKRFVWPLNNSDSVLAGMASSGEYRMPALLRTLSQSSTPIKSMFILHKSNYDFGLRMHSEGVAQVRSLTLANRSSINPVY